MRVRRFQLCLAVAAALAAALPSPAAAEAIEVVARALPLDHQAPERNTVGRLKYRGGLLLGSTDPRFGGYSALTVSADGARLLAISDRGHWLRLGLVYVNGDLATVKDGATGALRGLNGAPLLSPDSRDAEAITRAPGGGLVIGFERAHRLWAYRPGDDALARPTALTRPPDIGLAPSNGGIEALATLADGRYLAIAEALDIQGGMVGGWVGDGAGWTKIMIATDGGFRPTGADRLPGGDIVLLERRFDAARSLAIRLRLIRAGDIRPRTRISPTPLATLEPPLLIDNFEGVAARRGARGETLIYLISDDNFSSLQRTLLLMFELKK